MVKVEIEGCVIDESFARILVNNPSLTLPDVMLLDKVQKHKPLKEEEIAYLRKKKFVEGRKNNLFLSSKIATTSQHVLSAEEIQDYKPFDLSSDERKNKEWGEANVVPCQMTFKRN